MYIYIYKYIHVYIYVYICMYVYIYIYMHMRTRILMPNCLSKFGMSVELDCSALPVLFNSNI